MLSQKIPQMCVMAHIKATNSERATAKIAKTATTSTIPRTTVPQPPQVTPMPPMTTDAKQAARLPSRGGRGSRSSNNRPPPGAVNLERSYQICQAVIQNSPNRHQLKAQLRPPPSMLSLAPGSSPSSNASNVTIQKRNETVVTSAPNRVIYKVYHTSSAIYQFHFNRLPPIGWHAITLLPSILICFFSTDKQWPDHHHTIHIAAQKFRSASGIADTNASSIDVQQKYAKRNGCHFDNQRECT